VLDLIIRYLNKYLIIRLTDRLDIRRLIRFKEQRFSFSMFLLRKRMYRNCISADLYSKICNLFRGHCTILHQHGKEHRVRRGRATKDKDGHTLFLGPFNLSTLWAFLILIQSTGAIAQCRLVLYISILTSALCSHAIFLLV